MSGECILKESGLFPAGHQGQERQGHGADANLPAPGGQALDQDHQDQDGQHHGKIDMEQRLENAALRQLQTGAGVCLRQELIEAPAPFGDAEQQVHQGADGQQQIADNKVLAVQHILAQEGMEAAPQVVAQDAGQTGNENEGGVEQDCLLPGPAEVVAAETARSILSQKTDVI